MAEYNGSQLFTIPRPIRIKNGVNVETIAAEKVLTYRDSQVQMITPSGGTQNVKLPALKDGAYFYIYNKDPSNAVGVNTPSGVGLVTLAANDSSTPAASGCFCWSDGEKWYAVHITCSIAFSA